MAPSAFHYALVLERYGHIMKKLALFILAIALLFAACEAPAQNTPETLPEAPPDTRQPPSEPSSEQASATPEMVERWVAEPIPLPEQFGERTLIALINGRIWMCSEDTLYSMDTDGSKFREERTLPETEIGGGRGAMFGDSDGNLYFITGRDELICLPSDGSDAVAIDRSSAAGYMSFATQLSDGSAALVVGGTGHGVQLYTIDPQTKSLGKKLWEAPLGISFNGLCAYDVETLLLTDGNKLFTIGLLDPGETTHIVNYDDLGVTGEGVNLLGRTDDGAIIMHNIVSGALTRVSYKLAPPETRVTLELAYIDWKPMELSKAVALFNNSSKNYKITAKEYSETNLNLAVAAGEPPDLILVENTLEHFQGWAAKGVFEDLQPYFDTQPELALLPNFVKALSTNGKLYRVAPGFWLSTLYTDAKYVDKSPGWTAEEMLAAMTNMPDGYAISTYLTGESLMDFLVYQNLNQFVDWNTGEVSFDGESFKGLLRIANDKTLVSDHKKPHTVDWSSFAAFTLRWYYSNFDVVWKGFPSADRSNRGEIVPILPISVTSGSKHKDGAWTFITYLLSPKVQEDLHNIYDNGGFAATITGFENQKLSANDEIKGNDAYNALPPLESWQVDEFAEFIKGIDVLSSTDRTLRGIIESEVGAYFAGDKSLDDVCRVIQSRAEIYVNEQR
jgi:ABC-type glycerol-3-phosphate transport system substrate-binding protein